MQGKLVLHIFLICSSVVGFILPSYSRPDLTRIDKSNKSLERIDGTGSRHISAALQSQILYSVNTSDRDSSRVAPAWQREGLAGFGVGTVYMLDRPSVSFSFSFSHLLFQALNALELTNHLLDNVVEIGTPQQRISLILDTGSSTTFVDPDCVRAADPDACRKYGHYDTSASITALALDKYFAAQFGTGYMEGSWYNDTIYVGQDKLPLPRSRIGVNIWSTYLWAGILGVSYGMRWNTAYPTLLDQLVQLAYIEVPIFSLEVGMQGNGSLQSGSIVFGGVNRWKYRGYLEPVQIWPNPSDQKDQLHQVGYSINLTSFGFTRPGQSEVTLTSDDFARTMLIDTGSTFTYLDADLVAAVAQALNAWIDEEGVYYVNCELRSEDGFVSFGFNRGNMVIRVSYADFIVDFDTYCALGVQPADLGVASWVLGNSFIRAAYIVFDQMNDAIWLAQYMTCDSDDISDLTVNAGRELWLDYTGLCW
ncbi:aspartic peptidase domain-containing protein [Xylaria bambusicola]|uniref:aspartic peptidase domain-containing protein n=1 Tax=Xylaria bambusicola TaxID=326684 RepID=UPI0020085489|nr:aspartic peptidase domain-containing protein [Xylaria bambusicola]KAI0512915.1 aspartic peptidase domain-containing protein [Xylaria bambusicola]